MDLLRKDQSFQYLVVLACLGVFITISFYNYLLFHTMAELFSIAVAMGVFIVGWNARRRMDNGYLLLIAVAYLFVALLDTLHTLAYKGMGVFPGHGADLPTQLWVAARMLEASALLAAPLLMDRKLHPNMVLAVLAGSSAVLTLTVFAGWFPDCYIEGQGLTIFKRVSEYVICVVLVAAALLLYRRRKRFDSQLLRLLLWSIAFTIAGELAFTFYVNVYGLSNLIGHLAKIVSFSLIYRAVIVTTLFRPQDVLFRHTVEEVQRAKEREKDIQDKLQAIIEPNGAPVTLELADIIDHEAIQSLMDDFHALTGIGISVLDLKGNVLVATGWQDICVNYHRRNEETAAHCLESDTELSAGIKSGEFKLYKCKNSMWDICTPIMLGDRHLGNLFLGQFLFSDEEPERELFRQQARRYGFNEREYLAAVDRVPRWSRETVDSAMGFYSKFAAMVSRLSGANFQLARSNAEKSALLEKLSASEEKYRKYIQNSPVGIFVADAKGHYVEVNKAACEMLGFSEEELLSMSITDLDAPLDGADPLSSFSKVKNEGRLQSERRLRRKDGGHAHVLLDAVAVGGGRYMAFCQDISLRKQIESSLQESEERFRLLAENTADMIWTMDEDHNYTYYSPSVQTLLGYTPQEIMRLPFTDRFTPESLALVREMIDTRRQSWASGQRDNAPYRRELEQIRKDGSTVWTELISAPMYDTNGRPVGIVGVTRDISERKQADERLRVSEKRLREAQGLALVGNWEFDIRQGTIWGSDEGFHIYGMTPPESNLLPVDEIEACIPERERVHQALLDLIHEDKPYDLEFEILPADGSPPRTIISKATLERDTSGAAVRAAGVIQDITHRKRVDAEKRASEERFRRMFAQHPLPTFIWTVRDGGFVLSDVNDKAVELTHGSAPSFVGRTAAEIYPDMPQLIDDLRRCLTEGRVIERQTPYRARGTGMERFVRFTNGPLPPDMVIMHTEDITEQIEAANGLLLAKEAAEESNRMKSLFLANMSHEIRTPLNGVMGMLQLLKTTSQDTEQSECIDLALQSSRRLLRLLSDILDLAKVEAGKMCVVMEPFDFKDAIDSVVQLFSPVAKEKGLDLRVHIDLDIPSTLSGDITRLQQVLSNLVGNAIKFTNMGHVELQAHPLPQIIRDEQRVLFSVSDTGIGIPDELMDQLFTPFTQAEGSYTRKYQGAGLGLAISRRIVELMGGNIAMESEEGVGTTLHLCIPFGATESASKSQATTKKGATIGELKVLLADDDKTSLLVVLRQLQKGGHRVQSVGDGEQALAKLRDESFDLVLMDVQMPVLDGIGATTAIRQGDAGQENMNIPIIAMTAFAMAGDKERFLEAGMDGYVSKPVEMHELQQEMNRVLGRGE